MDFRALVVAGSDQVSTNIDGQVVILNLKSGGYFGLSSVGARIWELIQEPVEISAVRDAILAEYEIDAGQCEKDLLAILESLEQAGLVVISHEAKADA